MDGVIPFATPGIRFEMNVSQLLIGNAPTFGIVALVKPTMDLKTGARRGCRNEIHNDLMGDERFTPPILRDKGKEPMLNLVPLAGSWR